MEGGGHKSWREQQSAEGTKGGVSSGTDHMDMRFFTVLESRSNGFIGNSSPSLF